MITVIKEGNVNNNKKNNHHIVCGTCKCDFVAETKDMHQIFMGCFTVDAINCPCCGKELFEWQGGGFDEWVNW